MCYAHVTLIILKKNFQPIGRSPFFRKSVVLIEWIRAENIGWLLATGWQTKPGTQKNNIFHGIFMLFSSDSGWCFGTCLFVIPFSWEIHHPNWWTHIFQRGRYTANQNFSAMFPVFLYIKQKGSKRWRTDVINNGINLHFKKSRFFLNVIQFFFTWHPANWSKKSDDIHRIAAEAWPATWRSPYWPSATTRWAEGRSHLDGEPTKISTSTGGLGHMLGICCLAYVTYVVWDGEFDPPNWLARIFFGWNHQPVE